MLNFPRSRRRSCSSPSADRERSTAAAGDSDEGACRDSENEESDEGLVLKLIGSDQDDFKDDVRGGAATHARQQRKRARRAR